jgi:hypothetical protein
MVDISGSDNNIDGAVISHQLLKVAGSNFEAIYNQDVISFE